MSAAAETEGEAPAVEADGQEGGQGGGKGGVKGSGRRKWILLAMPLLLGGVGAGLWFGGILPRWLGMGQAAHDDGHAADGAPASVFLDLPEIVANLNAGPRRTSYVKLKARLELTRSQDIARVQTVMPRLMDMLQTYVREMRPEELRGSAGTYRLREELLARALLVAAPVRIRDVLFVEILIQ